ncbi:phosphatidylglycerophosphate synthase [Rhizodiscina lignyota]|uniref:CDP-diacylglycerol--glycerol-3-phosphate 3-phosphatidyltransferase n=1 Tax=Rhizodiscina lignyota TaxID=1504668 RepID=A0A9P4IPC8_9PEZI|nr:phosphatidylglycerophosphate synthase [Rhizodiscina lignyota]
MMNSSALTDKLDAFLPRFDLNGEQIDAIGTPQDFYNKLVTMIRGAKTRIFLSSMYISKDAFELRAAIRESLLANPNLKISILMDALRGGDTKDKNPAAMLVPLAEEFGLKRVEVRLYRTPNLRGVWKWIVPQRMNEGFGLQHTKIYGVDDEDRYYHLASREVTDYLESIHKALCGFSLLLTPDSSAEHTYALQWPTTNHCTSPLEDARDFMKIARKVLSPLIRRDLNEKRACSDEISGTDTIVYPLAQFAPLLGPDVSTEQRTIGIVLSAMGSKLFEGVRWTLSTPYFNPTPSMSVALLSTPASQGQMVTGAPEATSFYGTAGLTGYIPAAFTPQARRFLKSVEDNGRQQQVQLLEWSRGRGDKPGGWTYHAKGLWITEPEEDDPSITIIGSYNYGERSSRLDLEQDVMIVTKNEELKRQIGKEENSILANAQRVTREELSTGERRTQLILYVLVWLIQLLGLSI